MSRSINVAVVGLGFGAEFVPLYQNHPDVASVVVCDRQRHLVDSVATAYGIEDTYTDLNEVLASTRVDAVHLLTPIQDHALHSDAVLRAGKHCASAVPMATTIEDLATLVVLENQTGLRYMMMETHVYTREFLFVEERLRRGTMGRIQFLRAAHYQDMRGWPDYWLELPPMHYATHAIAPALALAKTRAVAVSCMGSGTTDSTRGLGGSQPIETAIFRLAGSDAVLEVTRSLFDTAHPSMERFDVLCDIESFEWPQIDRGELREGAALFRIEETPDAGRGRPVHVSRIDPPDRFDLLPPAFRSAAREHAGRGGANPHLVHEFLRSIVEGRHSAIDAATAATWTAPGICAHESAQRLGEWVSIPAFASTA